MKPGLATGGERLLSEPLDQGGTTLREAWEAVEAKLNAPADQIAPVSAAEFRKTAVELGLLDTDVFDRMAAGFASDFDGLNRSLSRCGLVTAYQAAAICQGKARGLIVGDYLILDKLGQGGMGVVFKARHRRRGMTVALKLLPPRLARDRKFVLRFRREIQAAALLDHPNVVAALDADEDRGVHFMTMEYIEGIDLAGFVKNGGALSVEQAARYVIQAAQGLAAAHDRGIIHRDIKPGNLMLDATGTIRVLDLGLALMKEDVAQTDQTAAMTLTHVGVYMGTVDFMAPEQAHNSHTVDHRADIYSLACTLHFLLTVRPPFEGMTPLARLIAHQQTPAPSLRDKRPDVPEAVDALYLAMMAKQPDDRPSSMEEVVARLEACLLPGSQPPLAPAPFMTLPGPVWGSELDTAPEVAVGPSPHGMPGTEFAEVFRAPNRERPDTEPGLGDCALSSPTETATAPKSSVRHGLGTWHRLGVLASLGTLGLIMAIVTLAAINRSERGSRASRDPLENGLAIKPAIEAQERNSLDADASPFAALGTGTNSSIPATTPPSAVKQGVSAKVASRSNGRSLRRIATRPTEKKSEPSRKQIPGVASAGNFPVYEGVPCFRGHRGAVCTIAVTRDGNRALSAGTDHCARLWNIKNGLEISFAQHPSEVYDAAISPDGQFAFTCTKGNSKTGGAVRIWNMGRSPAIQVYTNNRMHEGHINAVATFPANGRALSGGSDGRLVFWDLRLRTPPVMLEKLSQPIHSQAVVFFPLGARAAVGGGDGLVHIWNFKQGKEGVRKWTGHHGGISSIAISADGKRAATGSSDGTVILWATDGSVIRSYTMPDRDKNARVAILPNGNVLAAGNAVGHLILWDANTGALLRQAKGPLVRHFGLAVLPDGQRVLTADQDGAVRIWTPQSQ
jgi:serine/threonine protein kinase/WD40 repeat protein